MRRVPAIGAGARQSGGSGRWAAVPQPGIASGALGRFGTQGVAAVLGVATSCVVARSLGPDGKGTVATLTYLIAVLGPILAFGSGEALVQLSARGRTSFARGLPASFGWIAVSGLLAAAVILSVQAWIHDGADAPSIVPLMAVAACLPIFALTATMTIVADALDQSRIASLAKVVVAGCTLAMTALAVLVLDWGPSGALVSVTGGWCAGAALLAVSMRRSGIPLRPVIDVSHYRAFGRLGATILGAQLLLILSARADLLVVNALAGSAEAGLYSVALTIGHLTGFPAGALAAVAYGRLARGGAADGAELVARLVRATSLVTTAVACILCLVLPLAVPLLFGPGFRPAVVPAVVLCAGAVLSGMQLVLCRAAAARGRRHVQMMSYGFALGSMLTADLVLIPLFGVLGAAIASVVGALCGLAVAIRAHCRGGPDGLTPTSFIPRLSDVRSVATSLRVVLGQ